MKRTLSRVSVMITEQLQVAALDPLRQSRQGNPGGTGIRKGLCQPRLPQSANALPVQAGGGLQRKPEREGLILSSGRVGGSEAFTLKPCSCASLTISHLVTKWTWTTLSHKKGPLVLPRDFTLLTCHLPGKELQKSCNPKKALHTSHILTSRLSAWSIH